MDSNDYYYQQPQPLDHSYHPGPASDDAASYSPTAPLPPIPMTRGNSSKSYHSTSSSGSNQYPEVLPIPLPEEMSYHDDNAVYNGYSHSYPSESLKSEDDRWYDDSQAAFVPDDSQLYYDYASSEPAQQNYTASPTTSLPPAASPPEDMM